jgi:hypothetical protein
MGRQFMGAMYPYIYLCHRRLVVVVLLVLSKKILNPKTLIGGSEVLKLLQDHPVLMDQ